MNKQDLNGVRTAEDLQRRMNYESIKKAVEQHDNSIEKINKEQEDFVNSLTGLETQVDGKVETYFYSGEPTLSTPPADEWVTTDYPKHLHDLYYDKDTGYTYIFDVADDVYSWVHITDADITNALSIANAASDTADSKRQVFVSEPIPPYSNGDLWLNNEELYVCQISKASNETYAENDFIEAVKYTDDTQATQVANELSVVRGQVTKVIQSADELAISFKETNNLVNTATGQIAEEISNREALIRGYAEQGIPVVELGSSTSPVKNKLKNDGMYIEDSGTTTTYYKNGKGYTGEMEILKSLKIGRLMIIARNNGHVSGMYVKGV